VSLTRIGSRIKSTWGILESPDSGGRTTNG
jgi:hypothetical protein